MRIEFIPHPEAGPAEFKAMAHFFSMAGHFLANAVHCEVSLSQSIIGDMSEGEPPRTRKQRLDETEASGYEVAHLREADDETNRRFEINLAPDALAVIEQLRLTTPRELVTDVLVEGMSIYEWFDELDGPAPDGADPE